MPPPESLLSQFADALASPPGFSDEALAKARLCLLDFLTPTLCTAQFPWVQQARRVAISNSGADAGGAPIIGTSQRVSVQDAAFVNAIAGHSLVRDDMHVPSVSHLAVVVMPAALALAEQIQSREGVSGRRLLEAILCGYEAGGKLGGMLMDVETAKKFRPTGLIGSFAAAATGARLAELDAEKTAQALGFAANYITGLNEWAGQGSDDMYFHPGIATRNGITAMQLASEGARAAPGSLDGKAGLFSAFEKTPPSGAALPFKNEPEIMTVFFKQVPACNYAQTAAQAALKARIESGTAHRDISEVSVKVPYAAANYPGCDFPGPFSSILQARMSIQFNVASALVHGNFDDRNYHAFEDPAVTALTSKVALATGDKLTANYPARQGAIVSLLTQDGVTVESSLEDVVMAGEDEVRSRFRIAAIDCLGQERAASLEAAVDGLEKADSVRPLLNLLAI